MTLRDCPLCGKNYMRSFEEGLARRDEFGVMWFTEKTEKFIECLTCGHTASGWEEGEAEEEWNKGEVSDWEIRSWQRLCGISKNLSV